MEVEEFRFTLYNTKLYGFHYTVENPIGVVVLVHGFGEHSGRYLHSVIPTLKEASLSVVTYDHIGHGRSGGKRGHCPSYEALMQILDAVIQKAQEQYPQLPLFLYGHSMGGNLVLNYTIQHAPRLAGLVATSPYLRLAFKPPTWKLTLGKLMLHVFPSITLPSGLDPNGISRIREEVEKYKKDALIHDSVSPMYSIPIMEKGEWIITNANQLTIDTLLLHGTADPIISCEATQELHQNANTTTLKLYEDAYHELHHDLCSGEAMEDIRNWLLQQL